MQHLNENKSRMYLSDYTDKRILERKGQILQIPSFMLEFEKKRKEHVVATCKSLVLSL